MISNVLIFACTWKECVFVTCSAKNGLIFFPGSGRLLVPRTCWIVTYIKTEYCIAVTTSLSCGIHWTEHAPPEVELLWSKFNSCCHCSWCNCPGNYWQSSHWSEGIFNHTDILTSSLGLPSFVKKCSYVEWLRGCSRQGIDGKSVSEEQPTKNITHQPNLRHPKPLLYSN